MYPALVIEFDKLDYVGRQVEIATTKIKNLSNLSNPNYSLRLTVFDIQVQLVQPL